MPRSREASWSARSPLSPLPLSRIFPVNPRLKTQTAIAPRHLPRRSPAKAGHASRITPLHARKTSDKSWTTSQSGCITVSRCSDSSKRLPGRTAGWRSRRVKGNFHARFLGGCRRVDRPPYPVFRGCHENCNLLDVGRSECSDVCRRGWLQGRANHHGI
jgi:hypothetical protein